jgi:hypothetical protein
MRKVHWLAKTKDKKTGNVPASYSAKESCPDSCSLKEGGCYAWGLFYLNILGAKINDGRIQYGTLKDALKDRNPLAKIVRHRIAGDILNDAEETYKECKVIEDEGLINIGYTHNWKDKSAEKLKKYFRASCDSMEEVLEARKNGWGATLVVQEPAPKRLQLPNGEFAIKCPARVGVENKKDITCNSCTLCKITDKTIATTVMFEIHGNAATKKKANLSILNKVVKDKQS